MNKVNIGFLVSAIFFISIDSSLAQEKRALTHLDYDGWETVSSEKISNNGSWVAFEINPQEGDGRLEIVSHQNENEKIILPRANRLNFSNNSLFAIGRIVPQYDSVRMLKLKKTKADNMPKDSLFILNLNSKEIDKLARVKSFSLPENQGNWLAIHFEKELPQKEVKNSEGDTTSINNAPKDKPRKGMVPNCLL